MLRMLNGPDLPFPQGPNRSAAIHVPAVQPFVLLVSRRAVLQMRGPQFEVAQLALSLFHQRVSAGIPAVVQQRRGLPKSPYPVDTLLKECIFRGWGIVTRQLEGRSCNWRTIGRPLRVVEAGGCAASGQEDPGRRLSQLACKQIVPRSRRKQMLPADTHCQAD